MPTPRKDRNKMPTILEGAAFKRQTFTRADAAAILNVSIDTVDQEIKRKKLKPVRRGSGVGITGAAIDEYQRAPRTN